MNALYRARWPLAVLAALALLTAGCAALSGIINQPSNEQTILMVGVEAGVDAIIEAQSPGARAGVAKDITTAAQAMQAVVANDQVTLSGLAVELQAALAKTTLTPTQQALAGQFVAAAVNIVAGKISNGTLTPSQATSVTTVLNWVIAGAKPFSTS